MAFDNRPKAGFAGAHGSANRPLSAGFQAEVEKLINKCCMENGSDTPDFILAEYLSDCLAAYDKAVRLRERWYGRNTAPAADSPNVQAEARRRKPMTMKNEQDSKSPAIPPLTPATGSADGPDFISELGDLINRRSMENASNTPDFILAQYLTNCLRAWNQATQQRETWYGRDARPTSPPNAKLRHGGKNQNV